MSALMIKTAIQLLYRVDSYFKLNGCDDKELRNLIHVLLKQVSHD